MKTFKYILLTLLACQLWAGCEEIESPVNTIPTVTTGEVTEITTKSAMLSGTIIGGDVLTSVRYFMVSTAADMSNPLIFDRVGREYHAIDNGVSIPCYISNLQPGTTYYVTFNVGDELTEIQGNVVSFTTVNDIRIASIDVAPWENSGVKENTPLATNQTVGLLLDGGEYKLYKMYTYYKDQWLLPNQIVPDNTPKKLYAYYPEDKMVTYDETPVNLSGDNNSNQYLYGSSEELTASHSEAHITMKHATARIIFHVTKAKELEAKDIAVTAAELYNNGDSKAITNTGRMNGLTGVITPLGVGSIYKKVSFEPRVDEATVFEMQVIPTQFSDGEVNIRLYSKTFGQMDFITLPASTWEAGKQYDCPITIINRETKPEIFNGHEGVDMGILSDDGNKMYWATTNVGANSAEDPGEIYLWGDPTGIESMNSIGDYIGDYDASSKPENISGTEYDIARNLWGSKWRIPTNHEWGRLGENSTVEFVTINDISGYIVTSTINGNSIFLPRVDSYTYYSSRWRLTNLYPNSIFTTHYYWTSNKGYSGVSVMGIDSYKGIYRLVSTTYVSGFDSPSKSPVRPVISE
jgi:hypothetical protein